MSLTACGACAETFIRNAELRRCSGKWNLGPFVLCFLPATTMSQLAQLSLSPHLLPLFCHQLENVWPTTILDAGSKHNAFSSFRGGAQSLSCLQVEYYWWHLLVLQFSGLLCPDPFSKFWSAPGVHRIRKTFQIKSAMQQIVIFDADDYPGLLQMSFKAFSYSPLPSFQLKLNKGSKEISLIENSFSLLERQAMLLPSSPHFFAFLFSATWRNQLPWGAVCFIACRPKHTGLWLRCRWGGGQWNGKFMFLNQTTSHNLSGI